MSADLERDAEAREQRVALVPDKSLPVAHAVVLDDLAGASARRAQRRSGCDHEDDDEVGERRAGIERQRAHLLLVTIETWYMRSGTAISDTIVVALKSEMKRLSASGSIRRTTCGSVMRRRISRSDMPNERVRPRGCPVGIGLDAGAEGLGEIAAVDKAERNHGGNEGMELDAACGCSKPISSGSTKCTHTSMT